MNIISGDIWEHHHAGEVVVITTNGFIKLNGECVMGRGTAQQAAKKYPKLPKELGTLVRLEGNHVHYLPKYHLVSFPVKTVWWEDAKIELVERSCKELVKVAERLGSSRDPLNSWLKVYMPKPGCGCGNLHWHGQVQPILRKYLDDRFYVLDYNG